MLKDQTQEISVREGSRRRRQRLAEGPRRRYTLDFKLRVLEETFAPDASVAAVARRHGMNTNVIFRWRRLFREGKLTGEAGAEQNLLPPPADFIPVRVIVDEPLPPPSQPGDVKPPRRGGRGMMEITLRGGVVIRVGADVDDEALARVAAVLGGLA